MMADLSIQVRDEDGEQILYHEHFLIFAYAMIIVYPLGVSALFFVLLFRNREEIMAWGNDTSASVPANLAYMEWMFHDFRVSQPRVYGEVFDLLRRIVLCSVVVLTGNSQVVRAVWGALIGGIWMQIFSLLQPYYLVETNAIAHIGNVLVVSSFVIAFFLVAEPFDINRSGFGWVMFVGNIIAIAAFVGVTIFKANIRNKNRGVIFDMKERLKHTEEQLQAKEAELQLAKSRPKGEILDKDGNLQPTRKQSQAKRPELLQVAQSRPRALSLDGQVSVPLD